MVGGGISGMTAAIEAAECGKDVVLVETNPSLGGRVSQLYKYFPKLCYPTCGMEINLKRLKAQKRLRVLTLAEVQKIDGKAGDYSVSIKLKPRYVNENCTACGACAEAVSAEIPNPHNYGLNNMKAAYLPHAMAYPQRYVLDAFDHRHAGRRQGQGRVQVRRHRPRHEGRDASRSRSARLSGRPAGGRTMPPRFSRTAMAVSRTSSPASSSSVCSIRSVPPAAS